MKFTVSALNLKKVSSFLGDVVPSRSISSESSGILVDAHEDRVIFSAVGSDTIVRVSVQPNVVQEVGKAVVNSGMLSGVINSFSPANDRGVGTEDVVISSSPSKGSLVITASTHYGKGAKAVKHRRTIPLLNFELFPAIPEFRDLPEFSMPGIVFREAVDRTSHAASSDVNSGPLRGIYMSASGGVFTCAATDSVKLAEYTSSVSEEAEFDVVVPVKFAVKVAKLLDPNLDITIRVSENVMWASSPGVLIGGILQSGSFPNYKKFLERPPMTAVIDKAVFLDNIRNVNYGDLDDGRVTICLSKNSLRVKTELASNDGVEATFDGEMDINFNINLLLPSVKAVPGTKILMGLAGPSAPVFFLCEKGFLNNGAEFTSVLMPLNVQ